MRNRYSFKATLLIVAVLVVVGVLLYGLGGEPTLEEKQKEMQQATVKISENITHLEDSVEEWRLIWQNVALGNIDFATGAGRLSEMAVSAKEIVRRSDELKTPRWLKGRARSDFENLRRDVNLAGNALSVACKAGSEMLKSGKLTATEIKIMTGHTRDAGDYLTKTKGVLEKFMSGFGLQDEK